MWRHGYNTSFYQVAEQMAGPATKSTVMSTIINKNSSAFPTIDDYFNILKTCALLCLPSLLSLIVYTLHGWSKNNHMKWIL